MGLDRIFLIGMSHESTPVNIREKVALTGNRLASALKDLMDSPGITEAFILSTCNRTEVMTVMSEGMGPEGITAFLADKSRLDLPEMNRYTYMHAGISAVRHLFAVACGLESMIKGEDQILGQVRVAYGKAQEAGTIGPMLDYILRQTLRVGKLARNHPGNPMSPSSLGDAAIKRIRDLLGPLQDQRILVVGAGDMAENVLEALHKVGAGGIVMANRTYDRALALAGHYRVTAMHLHALDNALAVADAVVSCTSAPHYIIKAQQVTEAQGHRDNRPLLLIDLAVPRDIEPSASGIPGVILFNVDDLADSGEDPDVTYEHNASEAIREGLGDVRRWAGNLEAIPTLKALTAKFEELRQETVNNLIDGLPGLDAEHLDLVDGFTKSFMKKALHGPVSLLMGDPGSISVRERCGMVEAMYGLTGTGAGEKQVKRDKAEREAKAYYPAMLDISGKECLVVGGGRVGRRKAMSLLDAGANLTVISPRLDADLQAMTLDGGLRWIPRGYREGDARGYFIVVTASNDKGVNEAATREAKESGALVNAADNGGASDFIVPSVIRRENLLVAVSTCGKDPALAKKIRMELEEKL